jgi:hypothetical protein
MAIGQRRKEGCSFLKERTKKLLSVSGGAGACREDSAR